MACYDQFTNASLPWPAWAGMIANSSMTVTTQAGATATIEDVPSFVALLMGVRLAWTATNSSSLPLLQVDEANEAYVELWDNNKLAGEQCVPKSQCQPYGTVAPLGGQKYAVSQCTRLIYNKNPVYLMFNIDESAPGSCQFGLFSGSDCKWKPGSGEQIELTTLPTTVENDTIVRNCTDFPASQGFQLKVFCKKDDLSPRTFRPASQAVLDLALHQETCVETGRIDFPCSFPNYCSSVTTPTTEAVYVNASISCAAERMAQAQGGSCTDLQQCLQRFPGINESSYGASCIANMCDSPTTSTASLIGGSAIAAFLAMF